MRAPSPVRFRLMGKDQAITGALSLNSCDGPGVTLANEQPSFGIPVSCQTTKAADTGGGLAGRIAGDARPWQPAVTLIEAFSRSCLHSMRIFRSLTAIASFAIDAIEAVAKDPDAVMLAMMPEYPDRAMVQLYDGLALERRDLRVVAPGA
jgi:hypothetical protein